MQLIAADTEELQVKVLGILMDVFFAEDNIPESALREHEAQRTPFLVIGENGEFIGTAGYRPTASGYKIERIAVLKPHRGNGTGTFLVRQMVKKVKMLWQAAGHMVKNEAYVYSQVPAYGFWQKMGFEFDGEEFMLADYPHNRMVWKEPMSPLS